MKRTLLLATCLGVVFAGNLVASSPQELLEDGKQRGLPPTTTKEITLSVPMDVTKVDLYTQNGKKAGIKIPLADSLAIARNITTLNIMVEEGANWRVPYLSKRLAAMSQLTSLSYAADIMYGNDLEIIGRCTNLTTLSLACNVLFDETSSKIKTLPFIEGLTGLQDLRLAFHNSTDNCRYLQSLTKLPHLRTLSILHTFHHQHPLYPCGGIDCLEQLTQISRLSLIVHNPDEALSLIYARSLSEEQRMRRPLMPSLTHCKLSFSEEDVDHQLQCFVPDSPKLEELHLIAMKNIVNLTEGGYKWLTQSKSLKALRLENIVATDQILELTRLPNLKNLQVRLHQDYEGQKEAIIAEFKDKLPECDLRFFSDEPLPNVNE